MLQPVPRAAWAQLKMKISCAGALRGRRAPWGAARAWRGDYLAAADCNPRAGTILSFDNDTHYIYILWIYVAIYGVKFLYDFDAVFWRSVRIL